MQELKTWVETLLAMLPAVFLAVLGGVVSVVNSPREKSICFFLASAVTAGFVGVIVCLLLTDVGISENMKAAVCGVSGCSAREILEIFRRKVVRKVSDFFGKK